MSIRFVRLANVCQSNENFISPDSGYSGSPYLDLSGYTEEMYKRKGAVNFSKLSTVSSSPLSVRKTETTIQYNVQGRSATLSRQKIDDGKVKPIEKGDVKTLLLYFEGRSKRHTHCLSLRDYYKKRLIDDGTESIPTLTQLAKSNFDSQKCFVRPEQDALSTQQTVAWDIPGKSTDTSDDYKSNKMRYQRTYFRDAIRGNASESSLVLFASNIDNGDVQITNNALNNVFHEFKSVHYTFVSAVEPRWIDDFKLRALQELHRGDAEDLSYQFVFIIIYANFDVDENNRRIIRFSDDDAINLQELIKTFVNTNELILGDPDYRALLLASPQNVDRQLSVEAEKQDLGRSNALIAFSDISQGLRGDGLMYINRLVEVLSPGTSFTTSLELAASLCLSEDEHSQQIPIYSSTFRGSVYLI